MEVDCAGTSSARRRRGATSPLVAATRADGGRHGARRGHSPQLSEGWVARHDARRPTGTEDGELSWCAPWRPEGARGALGGSPRSVTWLPRVLSLLSPVLAGDDGVDRTALSFLVRRAVEDRKREKEEEEKEKARKKKEAQEKAHLELAKRDPWWAQHLADMKAMEEQHLADMKAIEERRYMASSSSKRKRKKRRKRRAPRTSSLPGRARRRPPTVVRLQCWFYW